MNSKTNHGIRKVAYEYADHELAFANRTVNSVEAITDYDELHADRFQLGMTLSHSEEEIEKLVANGDPEQAEIKRSFLEGDFKLTLIVSGGNVVSAD